MLKDRFAVAKNFNSIGLINERQYKRSVSRAKQLGRKSWFSLILKFIYKMRIILLSTSSSGYEN